MKGTKIDFANWRRTEIFHHFVNDVKCMINVTADVDVTGLVAFCRREGLKFFPCCMYVMATVVNRRPEFRMGYDADSGDVVVWDTVHPSYIDFHPEDEGITRLVSRFSPQLAVFCETVERDMAEHRDKRGFEIAYDCPNTFDVSCLPWLYYRSLDLHVHSEKAYLAPVITWGKYMETGGRLMMPLSFRIHHAAADGFHIARFYADVSDEISRITARPQPENDT